MPSHQTQETFEFGPVLIVSHEPPIFMTGIAFEENLGIAPTFARVYEDVPAAFIIYPTWTIESPRRSAKVINAAMAHKIDYGHHILVFLCNTAAERDILERAGLDAHLLNKNFVVSDKRFHPLPGVQVDFDAVYNAKFNPFKRHELAAEVETVAYIGYEDSTNSADCRRVEQEYLKHTLSRSHRHILMNRSENGSLVRMSAEEVNAAINRAAVGLCLSKIEGSNYASMEYMLAGLPVVSTPSTGGREVFFDHEYWAICDPDPIDVRDAVQGLKARNIPREYVRARTLNKIQALRQKFLSLIDDLSEQLGGKRRHDSGVWPYESPYLLSWKTYTDHISDFKQYFCN